MRRSRTRPVLVVASTMTLFIFTFPALLADLGGGPAFYYRLLVFPADIALAATVTTAVVWAAESRRQPGAGAALLGLLTGCLAIAFAIHPSPIGAFTLARLAGASALAYVLGTFDHDERLLAVGALSAAGLIQLGLAIGQVVHGGPLGLPALGETAEPLLDYGALAPRGTMHGQYVLGGLALIVALVLVAESFAHLRPLVWSMLAGITIVPVGLTFSRAIALGFALALGALALGLRRSPRIALIAILCLELGAGTAAVVDRAGWAGKADIGLTQTSGRDTLFAEAFAMIASAPLTGVGPGRSGIELERRYPVPPDLVGYQPVHNLPILAAVEGGIVAGGIATALLLTLGWRSRRDPRAMALYLAFLLVVLTDHYPYTDVQGVVLLGVWVGTLDRLSAPGGSVA